MDFTNLLKIEYHGELVLTNTQLAEFYGCTVASIRHNFRYGQDYFKEGVHYFKLVGDDLREFKAYVGELAAQNSEARNSSPAKLPFTKLASSLYLWTKRGAVRHAKMIATDTAWKIFGDLERVYFAVKSGETLKLEEGNAPAQKCVYALEMENNTVKIGVSNNAEVRIKAIESSSGLEVLRSFQTELVEDKMAYSIEKACHEHFGESRTRGEFFNVTFEEAVAVVQEKFCELAEAADLPQIEGDRAENSNAAAAENLKLLNEFIKNCAAITDDALRDALIKMAAEKIFGEKLF